MDEIVVCVECGTQYEDYEKTCPLCGRVNEDRNQNWLCIFLNEKINCVPLWKMKTSLGRISPRPN